MRWGRSYARQAEKPDPSVRRCSLCRSKSRSNLRHTSIHTVKYAGVLAPASVWRARLLLKPAPMLVDAKEQEPKEQEPPKRAGCYRPWAELLARTFALDVLECPTCHGRMKLRALVTNEKSISPSL